MRSYELACCLVVMQVACTRLPLAPAEPVSRDETAVPEGVTSDPPEPFVLLPGDVVRVHVDSADARDLSHLVIDPMGQLHLPLIGDVHVAGLSLSDAESAIDAQLRQYERFARSGIFVEQASGHVASVAGAVSKPGVYQVTPNLLVADLIALSGGVQVLTANNQVKSAGDLSEARLIRAGVAMPIAVQLAVAGEPRHNTRVHPGDLLFVPPRGRIDIAVLGEVKDPRVVEFRPKLRASEALAAAGGPTRAARLGDIRLVRGNLSRPQVLRIDVDALVRGMGHDVELLPGDVIYVPRERLDRVLDVIQRVVPALAIITAGAAIL